MAAADSFRRCQKCEINMNTMTQEDISERVATQTWLTDSYKAATKATMRKLDAHAANPDPSQFVIRNILVPISSLTSSLMALKSACWFADKTGGKITILCNVPHDGSDLGPTELEDRIARTAGIQHGQFRAIMVRPGESSYMQVWNAARHGMADLIVIPADFYRRHHTWQGDPMERLIRFPPCPVLVVKNDESHSTANSCAPNNLTT